MITIGKDGNAYQEWSTLRAGTKGTKLVLKPTNKGKISFQLAKQSGTINVNGKTLPKFGYEDSYFFQFSDIEIAQIVRAIEKQFINYDLATGYIVPDINFNHQNSDSPKNIYFSFKIYNEQLQATLSVTATNKPKEEATISIYLNEAELECMKEICKCQYNFAQDRIISE